MKSQIKIKGIDNHWDAEDLVAALYVGEYAGEEILQSYLESLSASHPGCCSTQYCRRWVVGVLDLMEVLCLSIPTSLSE